MLCDLPYCGLDFGTSNSTLGMIRADGAPMLAPLQDSNPILRSAIYFDPEEKLWQFGDIGVHQYLQSGQGRLMMSLKSVLGSSLMQDKTFIDGKFISYQDILGYFIRHMKASAEHAIGQTFSQVVVGRPVRFDDDSKAKDKLAENTLGTIVKAQGFKDVAFQYEPVAAALDYEQQLAKEALAIVIDLGGGTADFSVIRLGPGRINVNREDDILANGGIHIGGTDFDALLSLDKVMPMLGYQTKMHGSSSLIDVPSSYYFDLTTWHTLNTLYTVKTINAVKEVYYAAMNKQAINRLLEVLEHKKGHYLLNAVEMAKRALSEQYQIAIELGFLNLQDIILVQRAEFEALIAEKVQLMCLTLKETLSLAKVKVHEVDSVFFTGGSSKIPYIQNCMMALFPEAEMIKGNAFGSVGIGLALEAKRLFGTKKR